MKKFTDQPRWIRMTAGILAIYGVLTVTIIAIKLVVTYIAWVWKALL